MKTLIVAAVLLATASTAFAATPHQRQVRQQHRIEEGRRHGSLTLREGKRLQRGHRMIRREIARAKADGVITKAERVRIQRLQNRMSKRIWVQKHDRQRRAI